MEFINIGTNRINQEYFYPIVNTERFIKPSGGFWCSKHLSPYYNEWLDYIMSKPMYYARYMGKENPFNLAGVVVSLKSDSRLLRLDNMDSFTELQDKYKFDYEAVSENYDAIYFDVCKLFEMLNNYREEVRRFITVNTMLLLNLESIDSYRAASIDIEPFDYTYECDYGNEAEVTINVEDEKRYVKPASPEYLQLLEDIYKQLKDIIFKIKKDNRGLPNYAVVELVRNELMARFGEIIKSFVESRGYDQFRITNSLAVTTYRQVK